MEPSRLEPGTGHEVEQRSVHREEVLADALALCREALEARFSEAATLETFRAPIFAFAKTAQREGVPPERALALFKGMMFHLPAAAWQPHDWRGDIMRQLVRMLIEDYYSRRDD
jgi:hypothetical protein